MLVVKTKLKEIKGKGISLIADQNIKKGDAIFISHPILDIKVKKKDIPKEAKDFFDTYSCDEGNNYVVLNIDNMRFTNHSYTPNMKEIGEKSIAIKDIKRGEELTIDYREIDVNEIDFPVN